MALSSCADHRRDSGEAVTGSARTGTILAVRPVGGGASPAALTVAGVLLAAGGPPDAPAGAPSAVELIIRTDSGGLLSLVEARDTGFRPGDTVRIVRGVRTSIAPP